MPGWRYSAGKKGVNRVTVFERPDATNIFVEWWDSLGRHRQSLRKASGVPVTDRDEAMRACDKMAAAQEQKANQTFGEMLGVPTDRNLLDLLKRLHADKGAEWSESYRRDQDRYRKFWEAKLGAVRLAHVTPAQLEKIAAAAFPKKANTRGKVLRYIVDAFYYAQHKLKWITEEHNLSAVNIPKAKTQSRPYTLEEAKKLLPALEAVDWRAGWIGYVAVLTGRRLTAIRTLPRQAGWFEDLGDHGVLAFPGETDKARNTGEAIVTGTALELTRRARKRYSVPSMEEVQDWLRAAEKAAGVPHKTHRSWHGLKRLYATLAKGHAGREKQSGTTGATLDRVYVQDERDPKLALAKMLAGRLAGQ